MLVLAAHRGHRGVGAGGMSWGTVVGCWELRSGKDGGVGVCWGSCGSCEWDVRGRVWVRTKGGGVAHMSW